MTTHDSIVRLRAVFLEILDEAEENPAFARNLERAMSETTNEARRKPKRGARRSPGVIDPFAAYADGQPALREELSRLDIEQLKDVIAEHGMDQSKLAMKWRTTDRLIEFIVATVDSRARKGRAFRSTTASSREPRSKATASPDHDAPAGHDAE